MEQKSNEISKEQARLFARSIYKDVSAYIEAHREEYEEFLQKEHNDDEKNQGSY